MERPACIEWFQNQLIQKQKRERFHLSAKSQLINPGKTLCTSRSNTVENKQTDPTTISYLESSFLTAHAGLTNRPTLSFPTAGQRNEDAGYEGDPTRGLRQTLLRNITTSLQNTCLFGHFLGYIIISLVSVPITGNPSSDFYLWKYYHPFA